MLSLPSRGAWIEITPPAAAPAAEQVAPLAGSVDRNILCSFLNKAGPAVAPLAGSVDRNTYTRVQRLQDFSRSPRGERG